MSYPKNDKSRKGAFLGVFENPNIAGAIVLQKLNIEISQKYLPVTDGVLIMIIKQVKEYGSKTKRQRIDLAKADGFAPGEDVVLIPKEQYDCIKQDILDLQQQITDKDSELKIAYEQINIASEVSNNFQKQLEDLRNQKINLQQVVKDAIAPIDEHYQKELENKDKQIKQLEIKYNSLLGKAHKNNLELMGLNAFEILIQRKFKNMILDFDQELTIVDSDPKVVDVDTPGLPGKKS